VDLQWSEHLEPHRATVHPAARAVEGVSLGGIHGSRVALVA
jgi:hypothetical protein